MSDQTLRLIWPQWQGAGPDVVALLTPELPFEDARRGYHLGTRILTEILPAHEGPTAVVPVTTDAQGLELRDGVHAKDVLVRQLGAAVDILAEQEPARVLTLGGECSVSVAPFAHLAGRYGDDLAVIWIDSHPDVGTPASQYQGYHAMAVAVLTGHGDAAFVDQLPTTVDPRRVALAGVHSWTDDDHPNAAEWGITEFGPGDLGTSAPLIQWLRSTGCAKVAIHLDVDVVDINDVTLGLGLESDCLKTADVRRIIADLGAEADIVGLTIAEFLPRQVIRMQRFIDGMPLVGPLGLPVL